MNGMVGSAVWAQAAGPYSLAPLALRRWFASLTLSSPASVPSLHGPWLWLIGLSALLMVAVLAQGPFRALGQVLDVPGHVRLCGQAVGRLRRAGRVVAAAIGLTVVSWTGTQAVLFSSEPAKDDLLALTRSRGLVEVAVEQGTLAALTPLRDFYGLSNNMLAVVIATVLALRMAAERWGDARPARSGRRAERPALENGAWIAASLYLVYRFICIGAQTGDLPLGSCLLIEPFLVPFLMVLTDGFLLAWFLVELRDAGFGGDAERSLFDPRPAIDLMPAAALACFLALPARYLATGALMASSLLSDDATGSAPLAETVRWLLTWGPADLQAVGLLAIGLAGAVAWGRGTLDGAARQYGRMLKAEGGRLVVVVALAGLVGGAGAGVAYFLVLALPAQPWVLLAADSYAHYVTLAVGLIALAALVELGERALPCADLDEGPPPTRAETRPEVERLSPTL